MFPPLKFLIAFCATILISGQTRQLPSLSLYILGWLLLSLILLWFLYLRMRNTKAQSEYLFINHTYIYSLANILIAILIAWLWAMGWGIWQMQQQLPKELENKHILVEGYISGIPIENQRRVKFDFTVDTVIGYQNKTYGPISSIQLSWYNKKPDLLLVVGQKWRFKVKLKRPHSFMNPGGFDYEAWLLQKGIRARGYVYKEAKLIAESSPKSYFLMKHRQAIKEKIKKSEISLPATAIITALMLGDRSLMRAQDYKLFRLGGISHLLAISGLHVTLVGGGIFLLAFFLLRYSFVLHKGFFGRFIPSFNILRCAAFCSLIFLWLYALWTGFSLPVQRAAIMLSVVFISLMSSHFYRLLTVYFIAMAVVLIINPLAGTGAGFYLSFTSFAIIVLISKYFIPALRPIKLQSTINNGFIKERIARFFFDMGIIQLVILCGLVPLIAIFFYELSLIGIVVNLIAIPLTSFVIMPWILLSNFLLFTIPLLGSYSIIALAWVLDFLYEGLYFITQFPYASVYIPQPDIIAIFLVFLAIILMIFGLRPYNYFFSLLLFLPFFYPFSPKIPERQLMVTFLDVGQGLAIHLRTSNHHLIYDMGASFSSGTDLGKLVISPYLLSKGHYRINRIVISHNDNDHSGGLLGFLDSIQADTLMMNFNPDLSDDNIKEASIQACVKGTSWQWDGVVFEILHPNTKPLQLKGKSRNNNSCVLLVSVGNNKLLLTGDITSKVENSLARDFPNMKVSLLQVPHHGSKSSSSLKWLKQIAPEYAVFSSGYLNPYKHPHPAVQSRYDKLKVKNWTTWQSGALSFIMDNQTTSFLGSYRDKHRKYWHNK